MLHVQNALSTMGIVLVYLREFPYAMQAFLMNEIPKKNY